MHLVGLQVEEEVRNDEQVAQKDTKQWLWERVLASFQRACLVERKVAW